MRLLSVVGNRPQFVKAAPLSLALREAGVDEIVVHTGQHWDAELSSVFFDELGLREPDRRLDLRTADVEELTPPIGLTSCSRRDPISCSSTGTRTRRWRARGRRVAAGVPVAHVEAGLRSGDLTMPEEHNRIEVDATAALLFCPDERSREQLQREGVDGRAVVVGDVMADASRLFAPDRTRSRAAAPRARHLRRGHHPPRGERGSRSGCSASSRASTGSRSPSSSRPTRARVRRSPSTGSRSPRTSSSSSRSATSPSPRPPRRPRVIVTDSGGLQKEAYWYGVPCVTARPSTEWVDTVELGANVLVDDDPDALVAAVGAARIPAERPVLYGDGHAAEAIAALLAERTG